MDKPIITSLSNPLIKQARALHQKKARAESGLFLVEGIHHVGEAVAAGWDLESVLYAPQLLTSEFARDLISRLSIKPQPVSVQVMESLADKENPQGLIALVHQRKINLDSFQLPPPAMAKARCVALVSPQDPGNVGTILRTMEAVGADALFLLDPGAGTRGSVELYHPAVVRSSMGTIFWKPVIQASFHEFLEWARREKFQLIGSSARGDVEFQTFAPALPWVLVLGNEQKGLSDEQTRECDVTVSIPMMGRISSLNLAVAAGILLYRFTNLPDDWHSFL
ncbi:MAG TPA: RNA methyltransferase [Anaerolineales bacterium]|nr:RNA methyltransferase [Anaerolineales bacterium]